MTTALRRPAVRLALAVALGFMAGAAIRPYVGAAIRALTPSAKPPPPLDAAHWTAKAAQFEQLDKADDIRVVYLGDSITEYVNVEEFVSLTSGRVANRGIAGDTTDGVLRRIRASFPREVAVCFLLVGYNDLRRGGTPAETADRVNAIVEFLLRDELAAHVVVESLPSGHGDTAPAVADFNARLTRLAADRRGVSFLDLWAAFGASDGSRDRTLFVDDVHLSGAGAVRRVRAELEHLGRVLPGVCALMRRVGE